MEVLTEPTILEDEQQQKKLIESKRKKLDLRDEIPTMWRSSTDHEGKLDKAALIKAVVLRIKDEKIPYEYELAKAMVDQTDRTMRPGFQVKQGAFSFYDAESYIPIGDNERRLMAKATKEDIGAWQMIEAAEFEASRVAYQRKTDWRFDLLATWRADEKTLADVEKRRAAEKN